MPVLLFFDISGGELMVILLVAFLVFGPSKIPEVARKIGRGMNEIRRASDEIKREINKETRKFENEMNTESSVLKEARNTVDEIGKDLGKATEPLNETGNPEAENPAPRQAKNDTMK
jgi:sec-independent protein translocase protein TatA